ncbi:MAG: DUF3568 family protein [Minicystis sp.]
MKLSLRLFAPFAAVAFAAAASGCLAATAAGAGAAAAVGTYAYERGELRTTIDAPVEDVHRATLAALEQMKLPIKDEAQDAFSAHVTAKQTEGGDVKVNLSRESDHVTRVGVRVGTFGDEAKARVILQRIRDAL